MIPGATADSVLHEVHAPFDGAPIATVEQANEAAAEKAIATAYALFRNRDAWLPPAKRIAVLEKTAALMQLRRDELALEAAREGGKPLIDSRVEADRAIDGVKLCIETLRTQAGEEIPMNLNAASANRLAFTRFEPIGVVLAYSAFNHPLNLIVHQVGPAIAAGCPVIVKPAKATPLSCFRFVGILREAGLPPEWCQAMITSEQKLATKLVGDRRLGFFSFIGSGEVGWNLRSKLAPGARCSLEHGGVAPVIVAADADLDAALPLLCKGGFYHAGQVCVSVQRIYADKKIALVLADHLAQLAAKLKVGDPTLPETEVGPLIRESEVRRVDDWVHEAADRGAKVLCGAKPVGTRCYAPTVLLDPPDDCRVSAHEVFAPVVCVYSCEKLDDAIARANALPYAFQAAVFTRDLDTALRATRRLDAAAVMVNDHTAFRVDWMPFAGLRESGHGIGGIPYTMHEMQIKKLVVIKSKEL
ncbi:MAG: aldehyde dehydrogenase family protein [Pirellulales bacterium]|nr:aldehyde dehydrogenase family protein [Pirellulales bacterium]